MKVTINNDNLKVSKDNLKKLINTLYKCRKSKYDWIITMETKKRAIAT